MPIPSVRIITIMTATSLALLGWLVIETQHGNALGLAERLSFSAQTSFPFVVAILLRRPRHAGARPDSRPASSSRARGEALHVGQLAGFAGWASRSPSSHPNPGANDGGRRLP